MICYVNFQIDCMLIYYSWSITVEFYESNQLIQRWILTNFILLFRFRFYRYSNIWQRRTTLEKVLLSFYVILGAIAVTSFVAYPFVFNQSAGKSEVTQSMIIIIDWLIMLNTPKPNCVISTKIVASIYQFTAVECYSHILIKTCRFDYRVIHANFSITCDYNER